MAVFYDDIARDRSTVDEVTLDCSSRMSEKGSTNLNILTHLKQRRSSHRRGA
jgi:hypothetical protein